MWSGIAHEFFLTREDALQCGVRGYHAFIHGEWEAAIAWGRAPMYVKGKKMKREDPYAVARSAIFTQLHALVCK